MQNVFTGVEKTVLRKKGPLHALLMFLSTVEEMTLK